VDVDHDYAEHGMVERCALIRMTKLARRETPELRDAELRVELDRLSATMRAGRIADVFREEARRVAQRRPGYQFELF
jgi:hypothetical protein